MIIIPAIDMQDGRCVRLFQGDFAQQTEYSSDPVAVAREFELLGLPRLHLVDLDGARSGSQQNQQIVRRITAETAFSIQLGGGIRDSAGVLAWLGSGVDRCVVGSLAVTEPDTIKTWLKEIGGDKIVLALDVKIDADGTPVASTHGWTRDSRISLWQLVDDYADFGLRHVLCTDISRDGAMAGPNIDLYHDFVRRYPNIALQASGGVRHIADLEALRGIGASAAITGRALLDGRISKQEISSFLRAA
jgi:phosphoribosylformimino-5-aminoimidazole carboxamide ribotide isomerase